MYMEKRGPKPKVKVKIEWSSKLAYAIGLIVTDGCLYKDERHISLTTKDLEQANNFQKCLGISVKNGLKSGGFGKEKKYYHVQFGDVNFYNFLFSIGITSAKSRTIGEVLVPDEFFFDYLRGCFDGDGCFYSYWDPRWCSSHMFYVEFISASEKHILWLRNKLISNTGVSGYLSKVKDKSFYQLKFAKKEALVIIGKMYYNRKVICLSRKKDKIDKALLIEKKQQKTYL